MHILQGLPVVPIVTSTNTTGTRVFKVETHPQYNKKTVGGATDSAVTVVVLLLITRSITNRSNVANIFRIHNNTFLKTYIFSHTYVFVIVLTEFSKF